MKARILKTWFWDDDIVQSVSKDGRFLWVFLLTNKELGMTSYVKIPDTILKFYTSQTDHELQKSKDELQSTGKIFFYNNWIFIPNLEKQNNYRNSPKNEEVYLSELKCVPIEVREMFTVLQKEINTPIDSGIDTSSDTPQKSEIRNKKLEISNKKEKKKEKKEPSINDVKDKEYLEGLKKKFHVNDEYLVDQYEKWEDYLKSTGRTYRDYQATFRRWIRTSLEGKYKF